ncbi:MAG: cell division protein FtsH [Myxococcales bacterium]|nr:cell division protein FtsH [Myxococcales bacterium]
MRNNAGKNEKISFAQFVHEALPNGIETNGQVGAKKKSITEPAVMPTDPSLATQTSSNIVKVSYRGDKIRGERRDGTRFRTRGNLNPFLPQIMRDNPEMQIDDLGVKGESIWLSILGTWLPILLLVFLIIFFFRQMQSGSGRAMSFGKSKHRMLTESQNKITFKDVAGVEEAKDELEEVIEFLKDPKKFTRLGGRVPKGVLLMGPPGTGKTLLGKAVAGEAGVPFFTISGSEFVEMFVGVGASRVRDLFDQAKKHAPCIIFVDEIDAVGRHRGAGLGGGHDEREQTLNQLLVEMDGFESQAGVIIMAATNRPDVLDPALLRPGRFDRRITVPRPDIRGREQILAVHTRRTPLGSDVKLPVIARSAPGFSGADLENLVNEAALSAARKDKNCLNMSDFEDAKDKVLMGTARKSMVLSEKERRTTAWHEAGHAIVAKLIEGPSDPLHKVTIIPRGAALGLTQQIPEEDRHSYSKDYVLNRIAVAMGGRIAEELKFNELTTGAGNDFRQATELARKMVTDWGMTDLGPISYGKNEDPVFLGMELNNSQKSYSEDTARQIDNEIKQTVTSQYTRARTLLETNRDLLDKVAESLLELETIDDEHLDWLMDGKDLRVLEEQRRRARDEDSMNTKPGPDIGRKAKPDDSIPDPEMA